MTIILKNKHSLKIDDFSFKFCIGKNGLSNKKKKEMGKPQKAFLK